MYQVAVEQRPIVLSSASAASATPKVATDGRATEVGGCAACDGYTTGGDKFCSNKCRERGEVDTTPL
jgi:hypothetical protein